MSKVASAPSADVAAPASSGDPLEQLKAELKHGTLTPQQIAAFMKAEKTAHPKESKARVSEIARVFKANVDKFGAAQTRMIKAFGISMPKVGDPRIGAAQQNVDQSARVTYRYANGQLIQNGVNASDVRQGDVGDSYLMAAAASLAKGDPSAIKKMFKENANGTVTVTFHGRKTPNGPLQKIPITVDRRLPEDMDGDKAFGNDPNRQELWPALLEKAYAQYRTQYPHANKDAKNGGETGYGALNEGGNGDTALQALTGKTTHLRDLTGDKAQGSLDAAVNAFQKGEPVTLGVRSRAQLNTVLDNGVLQSHTYSVLGVSGKPGNYVFTVRDPTGSRFGFSDSKDNGVFKLTEQQVLAACDKASFTEPPADGAAPPSVSPSAPPGNANVPVIPPTVDPLNRLKSQLKKGNVTPEQVTAFVQAEKAANPQETPARQSEIASVFQANIDKFGTAQTRMIKAFGISMTKVGDPVIGAAQRNVDPVARVTYHFANGQLIRHGIKASDVRQGYLGDCYFASAVSAIAKDDPKAIKNMMKENKDGTVTVTFHGRKTPNGPLQKIPITIDRRLPETMDGDKAFANDPARQELWPALLEKAYAQYRTQYPHANTDNSNDGVSGYGALDQGGVGDEAMQALTGKRTTVGDLTLKTQQRATLDSAVGAFHKGQPLTLGIRSNAELNTELNNGVLEDHMYSVLGVSGKPGHYVFTVRDPTGSRYGLPDSKDDGVFKLTEKQVLEVCDSAVYTHPSTTAGASLSGGVALE